MKKARPCNSYRLQLSESFGFHSLNYVVPFLKELGVDLVCTSPYFQVPRHSHNPYEICSSTHIDEKYGGFDAFKDFLMVLRKHKMGHMMDVVANHMASSPENPWFFDFLRNGAASKYRDFFSLYNSKKIVLPYLNKSLNRSILEGDLILDRSRSILKVHTRELPLRKGTEGLELKKLLEEQYYELIDYHKANQRVNYRRFFDIHELIGLNMNVKAAFDDYHKKIIAWYKKGCIQGFRVDHPDGLLDPKNYFCDLKKECPNTYIVGEKILQPKESLPADWNIDGSVGYDYLNTLNALFVDSLAEDFFSKIYSRFSGTNKSAYELLIDLKKSYCMRYLASEMEIFTRKIMKKAELKCSLEEFKEALVQFLSHMSIYRTYVGLKGGVKSLDLKHIQQACAPLKGILKRFFLGPFLSLNFRKELTQIQQIMPAVFAKGFEDTFLYRYLRLISLNEVGSTPTMFGLRKSNYIQLCNEKIKNEPYTMTTSSTHDTKRSEDVRLRISVLTQMPESFNVWLKKADHYNKSILKKIGTIDKNLQYLFYQTILGIWPEKIKSKKHRDWLIVRIAQYLIKASREAKKHTDWMKNNISYERGIKRFVKGVLSRGQNSYFMKHLQHLVVIISQIGAKSSISALLIRLTSCGVFDLYQGQECFKFDLVDPDNRRVVDFKKSARLLEGIKKSLEKNSNREALIYRWYNTPLNNRFRLLMLNRLLKFRNKHYELFIHGKMKELKVMGEEDRSVLAFIKTHGGEALIVIAPLFCSRINEAFVEVLMPVSFIGQDLILGKMVRFNKGDRLKFKVKTPVKAFYFRTE